MPSEFGGVLARAATTDDLRDFVATHLSASREFATTETSLILEHVRVDRSEEVAFPRHPQTL